MENHQLKGAAVDMAASSLACVQVESSRDLPFSQQGLHNTALE